MPAPVELGGLGAAGERDRVEVVDLRAMGSPARVTVHDGPAGLAAWASAELDRLERRWSRFRADSDLCRSNAAAGRGPVAVDPSTLLAVDLACRSARQLAPWFDPTVLDALEALGYDRTFAEVPAEHRDPAGPTAPAPGVDGIEVDHRAGTVALPAGVRIDLGGIGKGLAADLVAEGLVARGARGAAVGLGGDVRVCGAPPVDRLDATGDERWAIPVRDPRGGTPEEAPVAFVAHLTEADGSAAIVTSTRLLRRWRRGSEDLHHLVDPRTGTSSTSDVLAAVVLGGSAAWAESVAKAAVLAGARAGAELVRRHGCQGWLATTDGRLLGPV